ncbi:transposase, partial [Salmonella enterica]|uniref:transposase n=1 Tax=Salmonella enterica TaxID=28901 RepID=UPI003D22D834
MQAYLLSGDTATVWCFRGLHHEKSLAHTRWNCKYHIVFAPKYRRQAFYGEKRRAVGSILRKL